MRHGHDHVFALDQVLVVKVRTALGDLGPPRCCEFFLDLQHFGTDDFLDPGAGAQDVEIIG
jgi:hypothetical protein